MKVVSNFKNILFGLIILFIFGSVAYSVEFRGVATETYSGMASKKKINETLEIAKKNACKNAFNKYVQGMEESKRMIFESIEDQIYKNLNEYMVCSTVVEEDLDKKNKTVLVIGGSLGAKTINRAIDKNLLFFAENNLNLIWQTGKTYQKKAEQSVKEKAVKGINAYTFIKEMDKAYGAADIIISRAGAIAISELCCIAKPTILIPSPNVSEDHQTKNAQAVVNKKAALLVKDNEAGSKLVNCLRELIEDARLQDELAKNIKNLAVMDAADKIANEALILSKK